MKCNSVINHGKNKYWETKKLKQFITPPIKYSNIML